jgi:menaquinone-dependent protoporphyrinogen oxidase
MINKSSKILVTYATRTDSTRGVAQAIGDTLAQSGAQVVVLPINLVLDLSLYQAVVVGSAIQNRQWLPEAMTFVRTHQRELANKPFAPFLVCMTLAMPNGAKYRSFVSEFLSPVRSLASPVSEGLFAGGLDISRIPSWADRFKFRLSVMMGVWKEGDHRDWSAIRAWAEQLKGLF